jgi:hypothetical protein
LRFDDLSSLARALEQADRLGRPFVDGSRRAAVQQFIEANPGTFRPVFCIAAYDQELETPCIKVFVGRPSG